MHLIGYWITSLKDEQLCAPQELVGELAPELRARLAQYLDKGYVCGFSWECSWCWFCEVAPDQMGTTLKTDGAWAWPGGLSHYVREHGVVLPEEFVAHALARRSGPWAHIAQWRLRRRLERSQGGAWPSRPLTARTRGQQMHSLRFLWLRFRVQLRRRFALFFPHEAQSLDFWVKWCAEHRSSAFLDRLRQARAEADGRVPAVVQRRVEQEIDRYGLSDQRCIFKDCCRPALKGIKFCARHSLYQTDDDLAADCYRLTPEVMQHCAPVSGRAKA